MRGLPPFLLAAAVAVTATATACGGDDSAPASEAEPDADGDADAEPDPGAVVSVGQGYHEFRELAPGDPIEVHLGPQGGYMIYVAYRVSGLDPGDAADPAALDNPKVTVRATRGELFLGAVTRRLGLRPVDDATFEGLGTALVFRSGVGSAEYLDQVFDLTTKVTDSAGRAASTSLSLTGVFAGETDFLPP